MNNMRNLLILICAVLLSISVMAQTDSNTKSTKKTNEAKPVEFTIKKVKSNTLINKKLNTIHPSAKVVNSQLKQYPDKAIDDEQSNSKAVKKD